MAVKVASDLKYPDVFAALGKFIAEKDLHDVCILEFEDGVIVSGSITYEGSDALRRTEETIILSGKDLARMIATGTTPGKRNLFGR